MFADDTSIFCFGSNLNQIYATLDNQLKIYCKWFNTNKLSINANKIYYIIFHKSRQNVYTDNLFLNDSPLHRVAKYRKTYLGNIVVIMSVTKYRDMFTFFFFFKLDT